MKKVCIVSCFDCYQSRTKFIERYYADKGFEVMHLIADFSHFDKKYIKHQRHNIELIHVSGYSKNLSLIRINSHRIFSGKVYNRLLKIKPDVIYCNIPPNLLCGIMAKYKKQNGYVTLIFDLFDLWPESMIYGKDSRLFKVPFYIWANLRNRYINYADYIITECELYKKTLENILDTDKTFTLYACRESSGYELNVLTHMEDIRLCYIGSINNIIDISAIRNIIEGIVKYKDVTIHIIGDGERKDDFVCELKAAKASVCWHGAIYDEKEKYKIMSECHFGLNIMKDSVCVGLTLKSLCYFEAGLPVINNIKEDTFKLVEKYRAGFNIPDKNVAERICALTSDKYRRMRINAKMLYSENLSDSCLYRRLEEMNI